MIGARKIWQPWSGAEKPSSNYKIKPVLNIPPHTKKPPSPIN
jgi:hypothetical protein